METRISFLRNRLKTLNLNGMVVVNEQNVRYLTGLDCEGILLITKEYNIFLTMDRFVNYANQNLTIDSGIVVESIEKVNDFTEYFEDEITVGIEEKDISVRDYNQYKKLFKVDFKDASDVIENIREVKEENEIQIIHDICEDLDKIMLEVKRDLSVNQKEKRVAINIEEKIARRRLKLIGNVRVSFGENTASQTLLPTDNRLRNNDVAIIQFSASREGYVASIGRTFFIGNPEDEYPKIKENYSKLYKLQDDLLRTAKNGVVIRDIVRYGNAKLEEISWNLLYYLGHGIGIEKEEAPVFSRYNLKEFKENMTMVLNPQIYVNDKYGLLIEDTVKITQTNFVLLTKVDRDIDYITVY